MTSGRDEKGRFSKGNSGRKLGSRNHKSRSFDRLWELYGESILEQIFQSATSGSSEHQKMLAPRLLPRSRPLIVNLPPVSETREYLDGLGMAATDGLLSMEEVRELSKLAELYTRVVGFEDLQTRIEVLEKDLHL